MVNLMLTSVLTLLPLFSDGPKEKGQLFIIGGGDRVSEMQKFVDLAGGPASKIVVIPMAGGDYVDDWLFEKKRFEAMGCTNVISLITDRAGADADSTVAKLEGAKGVFMTGGDQVRLTKIFLGTKTFAKLKSVYQEGAIIGGTSAGAAVMSKIMLTGEELVNKDSTTYFHTIQKRNVEAIEGFGLISEKIIIDQHFIIRKRLNRLISVLIDNPGHIGIGIDESTGILVKPDYTFEVFGGRTVVIVDATDVHNIRTTKDGLYAAEGIKIDILMAGDRYDFRKRKVVK